jgi:glucokinase
MSDSHIVGADIGGSHITVALADIQSKSIVKNTLARAHVRSAESTANIIDDWCRVLEKVIANAGLQTVRIGIAMPGPFDYEKGISYIKGLSKYESLYNHNVKQLISEKLELAPDAIKFKNDAGCFLQGEVLGGAAAGYDHAIGFTVGTGIGTAKYHKGVGEDADLWKLPFGDTVAEDYLATRWFTKRYYQRTGKNVADVKELVSLASSDREVSAVFDEFADNLAEFLSQFVAMENPEVIVMGGNVSKASDHFLPRVLRSLQQRSINIPVKKAILGEEAAILGAAWCWGDVSPVVI